MDFRIGGHLEVCRLGFGAMHLPTEPGSAREEAIAVVRRAVELGVTLIDSAHLYGGGANEELLASALYPYPAGLVITTKVGVARTGPGGEWRLDARPRILRDQVEQARGGPSLPSAGPRSPPSRPSWAPPPLSSHSPGCWGTHR